MLNRYIVFTGANIYGSAGWNDYCGDFADLESAHIAALEATNDWWQIVDSQERKIVAWDGMNYGGGPDPKDNGGAVCGACHRFTQYLPGAYGAPVNCKFCGELIPVADRTNAQRRSGD